MRIEDPDIPKTLSEVFGHLDHAKVERRRTRARQARVMKRATALIGKGMSLAQAYTLAYREADEDGV